MPQSNAAFARCCVGALPMVDWVYAQSPVNSIRLVPRECWVPSFVRSMMFDNTPSTVMTIHGEVLSVIVGPPVGVNTETTSCKAVTGSAARYRLLKPPLGVKRAPRMAAPPGHRG